MVDQLQSDVVYDDPAPYSLGTVHGGTVYLAGKVVDVVGCRRQ